MMQFLIIEVCLLLLAQPCERMSFYAFGNFVRDFKTFSDGMNPEHQKALLSELKIMIYIGNHINVLRLIGAVTKRMVSGQLYVATEFCEYGSLDAHLKKHRATFVNEIVDRSDYEIPAVANQNLQGDGYMMPNQIAALAASEGRRTVYKVSGIGIEVFW
jgi:serine/threonine protein kinase